MKPKKEWPSKFDAPKFELIILNSNFFKKKVSPVEIRIETYERLPPVATGDTPVVTGGLRWVSSTGWLFKFDVISAWSQLEKCLPLSRVMLW